MSAAVKSRFAYASIGLAVVHFVLETAYTIFVGQIGNKGDQTGQ